MVRSHHVVLPCLTILTIALGFRPGILLGQSSADKKQIEAVELTVPLVLDGKLEEDHWQAVPGNGGFLMTQPIEGGSPTERTAVRILYDRDNLYIGVICYDDDPKLIKAFQKKRDGDIGTDDRFRWILDTFLDGRNAYFFEINPAGAMIDGLLTIGQGTSLNRDWDGIWRAWTHVGEYGWSAEIRIPFRTLNFDPKSTTWGVNFQRTVRRKNEELMWTGHRRNQGLLRPQNAGVLTGLDDISQGLGLEVIPYGAVRRRTNRAEDGELTEKWEGDVGGDINYSITPGLKASVTINTDFAEAEVDNRQINLTRFPLFFPERRDFFLEGANIYEFAPSSGQRPYFSRRIGLRDGKPIPITYGARLLGRAGDYDIALLHVRTGKLDTLQPENFTVARVRRNFWKESRIGVVYTRRSTRDGELLDPPLQDRHTIGTDLSLNTSEFFGDENLQFEAFFVYHNKPISAGDSSSFWDRTSRGIRLNFPNQPWSGHISYREFGEAYDPAVGFHPRVGFRRLQPSIAYNPLLEESSVIRDLEYSLRFEHLMNMNWELLTQDIRPEFQVRFETGDRIEVSVTRNFERLDEDFDILRDGSIVIPAGNYTVWRPRLELSSASWRRVGITFNLDVGGFWSGNSKVYELIMVLRPTPGLNLTATYIHQDVDLAEGSFSTDLARFNIAFDITPFVSLSSFIQYDNVSDQFGMNNRFRWIITPGTDLFLVYNHNWLDQIGGLITTESTATLKAVYTHRF